jgi:DNA-binding GntR family transcriptional regulator
MAVIERLTTIQEKVYDFLLAKIISGGFEPGTQLVDRKIAAELGVSRTPVRETLAKLSKEGIISGYPKWGFYTKEFSMSDFNMIFDVREGLEGTAARLAARNISEQDVYGLEKACAAFDNLREWDHKKHGANDFAFHTTIAELSGNIYLHKIVENYHILSVISMGAALFRGNGPENSEYIQGRHLKAASEHEGIVAAIIAHEEEKAEKLMIEHIIDAKITRIKLYEENKK